MHNYNFKCIGLCGINVEIIIKEMHWNGHIFKFTLTPFYSSKIWCVRGHRWAQNLNENSVKNIHCGIIILIMAAGDGSSIDKLNWLQLNHP